MEKVVQPWHRGSGAVTTPGSVQNPREGGTGAPGLMLPAVGADDLGGFFPSLDDPRILRPREKEGSDNPGRPKGRTSQLQVKELRPKGPHGAAAAPGAPRSRPRGRAKPRPSLGG